MKTIKSSAFVLNNGNLCIQFFFVCLMIGFVLSGNSPDSGNNEKNDSKIYEPKIVDRKGVINQRIVTESLSVDKPVVQKNLWIYTTPQTPHRQKSHIAKNQTTSSKLPKSPKTPKSKIPKSLAPEQEQLFNQINLLNTKYFAQKDNYTMLEINQSNYDNYISAQNSQKIQTIINLLNNTTKDQSQISKIQEQQTGEQTQKLKNGEEDQKLKSGEEDQKLKSGEEEDQFEKQPINATNKKIIKRLIIYYAILQNGGVYMDSRTTLVESLDQWIQKLPSSPFINPNIQTSNQDPYCLAFYNDSLSSMKTNLFPQKTINGQNFAVLYPDVQDYFLACGKGNKFLQKLASTYTNILTKRKDWQGFKTFNNDEKLIGLTKPELIYEHGHLIASHFVLQQQQQILNKNFYSHELAIVSLSLFTINSRLGPQKLLNQFSIEDYKTYIYLLKLSLEELQLFIGPLRFVFFFNDQVLKYIAHQFLKYESNTTFVQKNSFFHIFWLRNLIKDPKKTQNLKKVWSFVQIYRVVQESINQTNSKDEILYGRTQIQLPSVKKIILDETKPKWQSLDKNIWIIWDSGIQGNSNLIVELCYENLKRSAQNSGFKVQAISKNQVHNFISDELLSKISYAIKNATFDLGSQAISDLWRLALIYEHEGVYFDASTFMMDESFDWITKVTQFPQNLIWNRYGIEPQVFMFWNTYYCNAVDWKWDRKNNVRAQWQLSLESNFIAAVKGSELIKEWLQAMLEWVTLPFGQIEKQMKNVSMYENRWTSDNFWHQGRYLTIMDAIKYVLGRREKLIQNDKLIKLWENSGDYYKIWSIPGQFIGQQKLRGETNYENRDYRLEKQEREIDNVYKYQYPMRQAQKVVGAIDFQGKFFNWELIMMNKMLIDFYLQNQHNFTISELEKIIHPESVVALKLINKYPQKTLELLEYYSQLSAMKLKVKGFVSIWAY